jgi:FkbM family methyltransferase
VIRNLALSFVNRAARIVPRGLRRRIADFPGILGLFEKLSRNQFQEVRTPEGYRLALNPLFHSNLVASGNLEDYEPEIRALIRKFTMPGMTAYDIGANVGVFSYLFASIVGKDGMVYAFEPEKNNCVCFEKSLAMNPGANVILDRRAVGSAQGEQLFDRRGGAFSGRLIGREAHYRTTENVEQVQTVSIDHLVNAEGFRPPDILKIDVEGNEGMVLEGMRGILASRAPIIICELHTHLGDSSERVLSLLREFGYEIHSADEMLADLPAHSAGATPAGERHIVAIKPQS